MISVIVVTYNQERTIGRTLDSILAQRVDEDVEIVVGDDCSTDGTEAVCRRYAAAHPDKIRYIRRERNLGVVRNYFDCIAQSRGEFLADCAGDDFWVYPDKLQSQLDVLRARPEVSMVVTDWVSCDPDGCNVRRNPDQSEVTAVEEYEPGELVEPILARRRMLHLCTALYRRAPLERQLAEAHDTFVNPEYTCEDLQITLAMAAAGRVVMLPRVTLHYSVGHDSVSHRHDPGRRFDYSLATLRQNRALHRHFGVTPDTADEASRRLADYMAAMAFQSASPERRETMRQVLADHWLPSTPKTRLYMALSAFPLLWKATLKLKSKF